MSARPCSTPPQVLVVDARPHNTFFLKRALELQGYAVKEAHTLEAAQRSLDAGLPAALVLELDLPDGSGLELCKSLRSRPGGKAVAIIVTSALAYVLRDELRSAGADWYVPKPVSSRLLISKLAELVHQAPAEAVVEGGVEETRRRGTEAFVACLQLAGIDASAIALQSGDELLPLVGGPIPAAGPGLAAESARRWKDTGARHQMEGGEWSVLLDEGLAQTACARIASVCEMARRIADLEKLRDGFAGELEQSSENIASLHRLHWRLSEELDVGPCLELVLAELVSRREDWCAAFFLTDEDGLAPAAWSHERPPAMRSELDPVGRAARGERAQRLEVRESPWAQAVGATGAMAVVPLSLGEEARGCLLVWSKRGRGVAPQDTDTVMLFADQGGAALRAALVRSERQRSRRIAEEHALGGQIQDALLKTSQQQRVAGLDLFVAARACRQVAGDFFESLSLDEHGLDVIVGDVMGKGLPAAVFAAAVKNEILRQVATGGGRGGRERGSSPVAVVRQVNRVLSQDLARFESFVTLYYAHFDRRRCRMEVVNCGHTRALHWKQSCARAETVEDDVAGLTNLPLGIAECAFTSRRRSFEEGDVFLLYSDGVTEARSAGAAYGQERLVAAFERHARGSARDIASAVLADLESFLGGSPPQDDVTLLVLRVVPIAAPSVKSITLPAETGSLEKLRAFVREGLATYPALAEDPTRSSLIQVAVVEGATNIIRHAYRGEAGKSFAVECHQDEQAVRYRLMDTGRSLDEVPAPLPRPGALTEGGRGLFLMQEIADEVRYSSGPSNGNCLTLTFALQPAAGRG